MRGKIISYIEMCSKEGSSSLQKGMNYKMRGTYSVFLMSVRENSPYQDDISEDGTVLVYEGHDEPARKGISNPKLLDQPEFTKSGKSTQNGMFHLAAQGYKSGRRDPEIVQVYEKIKSGIWSDNGLFQLIDSWKESDGKRQVFKFKLLAIEDSVYLHNTSQSINDDTARSRVIPTCVKLEVWKRDGGKCVQCGATDELHFDHIVPFSKGGTSLKAENVQLLCARHNLQKSAKIQ